jgi:hypothetical protein
VSTTYVYVDVVYVDVVAEDLAGDAFVAFMLGKGIQPAIGIDPFLPSELENLTRESAGSSKF